MANGSIDTAEEATSLRGRIGQVRHCPTLLEDTPAVLSLGKLREENGYSCEWKEGQNTKSFEDVAKITLCKCDNLVRIVVTRFFQVILTSMVQQVIQLNITQRVSAE